MPLPYHLVDGYNLLHAAGLARASYGPGDLERARTGLLVRLADGLDDSERERTTVVFDAADPPPDAEHSFRFRGMAVLFAVREREADALIEDLIRRHPSPRQLRVVSDDLRLQKAAKRRGSQAVKSEAFLGRLKRRVAPSGPAKPVAPPDTAGGVGDWLDFFGMAAADAAITDVSAADPRPARAAAPGATPPERPATGRPARPLPESPAPAGSGRAPRKAPPAAEATPSESEDFSFWQRRIDDLLREDGRRPDGD